LRGDAVLMASALLVATVWRDQLEEQVAAAIAVRRPRQFIAAHTMPRNVTRPAANFQTCLGSVKTPLARQPALD